MHLGFLIIIKHWNPYDKHEDTIDMCPMEDKILFMLT